MMGIMIIIGNPHDKIQELWVLAYCEYDTVYLCKKLIDDLSTFYTVHSKHHAHTQYTPYLTFNGHFNQFALPENYFQHQQHCTPAPQQMCNWLFDIIVIETLPKKFMSFKETPKQFSGNGQLCSLLYVVPPPFVQKSIISCVFANVI